MVNINLLPKWRFIPVKVLILSIVILMSIIVLHLQCQTLLSEKQQKITLLKKELQAIESEFSVASSKNTDFIAPSHKKQIAMLNLFRKLPSSVPIGLYLTELSLSKNRYKLVGYAEKTRLISDFVNKLTQLKFEISVKEISAIKESDDFPIKFCLWVRQA